MSKSICYNCPDRTSTCHTTCKYYAAERQTDGGKMLELNQLYLKECKKIEIINWNELQKPQLFINGDCMEYMKTMPDNYAELAICDPPYGIGMDGGNVGYQGNNNFEKKDWDKSTPKQEYFNELFRVSKNQIIWGGNYFPLPPTRCFVIWDKGEGFYNRTYAEAELAWTSFDKNVKIFKRDPLAMRDYNGKINPCQKPINLYEFLLSHYAKPGDKILDTHVGSASSLIACHNLHFDYIGFEIDPDYYAAATERLEAAKAQMKLF